jgi:hypothetical protein
VLRRRSTRQLTPGWLLVSRARHIAGVCAYVLAGCVSASAGCVNQHALRLGEFERRVAAYTKLHKSAAAELPRLKPTESSGTINHHEQDLAAKIRHMRRHAKKGDIFTPPVAVEFRRLIGLTLQGTAAVEIRNSLHRAEPVSLKIRVNDTYPASLPLQSTPPTLLENLPPVPKELDYRLIGGDLVLRDVDANLVVDLIARAIP